MKYDITPSRPMPPAPEKTISLRGRPMLPPDEVKDRLLSVRLTPDERAAIWDAAAKAGLTPSQWARQEIRKKLGL